MGRIVTYPQWRLMSQRAKNAIIIIIIIIIISIIAIALLVSSVRSCGLTHIWLIEDLDEYYDTLDPEFCEVIVERIHQFNYECKPKIDIIDCG